MNPIVTALQITLAGMGLVFGAILILWGLMVLLTALIREREPDQKNAETTEAENVASSAEDGLKTQAAAAAVALALAEQVSSNAHPFSVPSSAIVGAWQLGMRTRQMTQKGIPYKKERR